MQGQDRDLLARRLSNAAASSAAPSLVPGSVPALEKRLSRRSSQQVPHWQSGRSTVQPNAVDLASQRSVTGRPSPLLQSSRRTSRQQSAASGNSALHLPRSAKRLPLVAVMTKVTEHFFYCGNRLVFDKMANKTLYCYDDHGCCASFAYAHTLVSLMEVAVRSWNVDTAQKPQQEELLQANASTRKQLRDHQMHVTAGFLQTCCILNGCLCRTKINYQDRLRLCCCFRNIILVAARLTRNPACMMDICTASGCLCASMAHWQKSVLPKLVQCASELTIAMSSFRYLIIFAGASCFWQAHRQIRRQHRHNTIATKQA